MAKALNYTHNYEILRQPEKEPAFPVPVHYWKQIMDRVEMCGDPSPFYDSLGWSCVSIGASMLLAALTLPVGADMWTRGETGAMEVNLPALVIEISAVALGIAFLAIGFVTLRFAGDRRKHQKDLRSIILDDMGAMRDRYVGVAAEAEIEEA